MKRVLFFIFIFLFSFCVYGESVKIIDFAGEVYVKLTAISDWQKPLIDMQLNEDAEIKTEKNSICTIIFDGKNILTVKENSQINLKDLKPVNIYLPKGRVFAIVNDLSDIGDFKIRTPTAIAGVRGTGEAIGFDNGNTTGMCFEGLIYIEGLDEDGNLTDVIKLEEGFAVIVDSEGNFSEIFPIDDEDLAEWEDFKDYIEDLTEDKTDFNLQDIRDEQRDDYGQDIFEDRRREQEREDEQQKRPDHGYQHSPDP